MMMWTVKKVVVVASEGKLRDTLRSVAAARINTAMDLKNQDISGQAPTGIIFGTLINLAEQGHVGWNTDTSKLKTATIQTTGQFAYWSKRYLTSVFKSRAGSLYPRGIMSGVTIVNNTEEKITVSITNTDDKGAPGFYEIASKNSSTWNRSKLQVCYVLRADNGNTEVLVVEPGKTYQVGGNMNEVTIANNTIEKITVSITNTGENGAPGFYEIASQESSTWKRSNLQVCHVLRTDNGNTEVLVVEPGKKYQVG
ncbi:hypothetical protein DFJ58DRAFT_844860 [Suillus subalutaceus]|uniref:uncharacterized protein n=1 Tax=Suillus subalutaceus TaxID=48586 RepID=UPI001B87E383|nr:uncharacterized protein DFJ58DRAFT_844860 [Suillus subalutaceus]KAG1841923.1 hypothetical protein DFJ58DRAFT_844860 [Suillus subalutaceus]